MKGTYKNCEINVFRDNPMLGRDSMLFYSIFYKGFEVDSGLSDSMETVRSLYKDMKCRVDDFIESLSDYGWEEE